MNTVAREFTYTITKFLHHLFVMKGVMANPDDIHKHKIGDHEVNKLNDEKTKSSMHRKLLVYIYVFR